jgi:hypothetical protein
MKEDKQFPLKDIAAKMPAYIEAIFGKPSAVERVNPRGTPSQDHPYDKAIYQDGKYEITFINGVADWITIYQTEAYTEYSSVLKYLGLSQVPPTFNNPQQAVWWRDIDGLYEVNFFYNEPGRPAHIYIKCKTK